MSHRDDESSDAAADSGDRTSREPDVGTPLKDRDGVYIPRDEAEQGETSSDEDSESSSHSTTEGGSIDFAGFVTSLGTNCMINVGEVEHPELGQTVQNLPAARQTIDILKMLKRKTQGNLNQEERNLLKSLIHDAEQAYQRALQSDS